MDGHDTRRRPPLGRASRRRFPPEAAYGASDSCDTRLPTAALGASEMNYRRDYAAARQAVINEIEAEAQKKTGKAAKTVRGKGRKAVSETDTVAPDGVSKTAKRTRKLLRRRRKQFT